MLPIPLCHTSSPPAASKATKLPLPSPVNTTPPAVASTPAPPPPPPPALPGCRGEDAMYVDCDSASVLFGQWLGRHGAAASTRPTVAHNRPHRLALKVAKHELRTQ